jgi:DNA-binding response OmpR family regulator
MKRILIVEDSRNLRLIYERELLGEGYEVILAADGREALARMGEQRPDLVVLDVVMPAMDGIEALGEMLSMEPTIPVLIHSAYSSFKDNFMIWAADAYVVKSADLTEFTSKVHRLLDDVEVGGSCLAARGQGAE